MLRRREGDIAGSTRHSQAGRKRETTVSWIDPG